MHILSIEDDLDTQANLCDILELDGYLVDVASTLKEALDRQSWSEYAAIILDRKLPDGTADEFLPQLKELAPRAAIIIVTGHADLDGTIAALRHGAADYILKPINPDALRASLARVFKLQEAEQRALQAERLAAIGRMMAAIAHESRNALQRIQAAVEMLRMDFKDMPKAINVVDRIERASDDIHEHFEEVRGFAAPIKLEKELSNVSAVWQRAWTNLGSLWANREVLLHEETNGIDVVCSLDAFRLEQVFRNLFENSLAACSDPVRIEVHCSETEIGGGKALRIAVRDNGAGLTEEQRQKVFDAFYTTKTRGMGLGMSIVMRIVEAHGGKIEIGSNSNPGAEVLITLPKKTIS
ncbi:MAG: response regulator [Chloroflexi bacterium]|nr:response regulator [Chloroflexota bacterium]